MNCGPRSTVGRNDQYKKKELEQTITMTKFVISKLNANTYC